MEGYRSEKQCIEIQSTIVSEASTSPEALTSFEKVQNNAADSVQRKLRLFFS